MTCNGNGVKQRSVECKSQQGNPMPVSVCQMDLKPDETASCSSDASCAKDLHRVFNSIGLQNRKKYVWRFGGWTHVRTDNINSFFLYFICHKGR